MEEKFISRLKKDLKRNKGLYLLIFPIMIYYFIFMYKPMYGALIAFQNYRPGRTFGQEWVGFSHFIDFFTSHYFFRLIRNTFLISFLELIFAFPLAIILALMLNEVRSSKFKKISQMIMHLPHFVSIVVVCGLVKQFCLSDGLINDIIAFFGGERVSLLQKQEFSRPIYVISDIWKSLGWSSLIYVAALSGVDTQLYDAASVDGAGRWKQTLHVTLPGILPTIVITLILRIGSMLSIGYEKSLLLYTDTILEVADIISTYVYRYGLIEQDWSYSTAVGMFNSIVNIILIFSANRISAKVTESSLW